MSRQTMWQFKQREAQKTAKKNNQKKEEKNNQKKEEMAAAIDIKKLSPEQREELLRQAKEDLKQEAKKKDEDRAAYKSMVSENVTTQYEALKKLSESIGQVKEEVFKSFATILEMKAELYGSREDQQSHTFSSEDGRISITIGHRVNEAFDDTLNVGIQKVRDYLATLAKDDESAALVDVIMGLLKKDAKGNLKASRVLELKQLAKKIDDASFKEGIEIIESAYKPVRTCTFIEVKGKDAEGRGFSLPLSISSVGNTKKEA